MVVSDRLYFLGLQNHCGWWPPWNEKMLAPWKKSNDKAWQHIKKQRHYFACKGPYSQSYGFSSSHVWMWELDNKKGWVQKNWCLPTVVLDKTLDSPLDNKEIKPVVLKEINLEYHWKDWCWSWSSNTLAPWCEEPTQKDPDAGKDWK